jgi:hypothetical protein
MALIDPCPGTYGPRPTLLEDVPAIEPYALGAMSAFRIVETDDPHHRNGIVYKQPACVAQVSEWVDDCDSTAVLPKVPTQVEENAFVRGCPWHLYAALDCKTTTLDAMRDEVREVFRLGEQRAVEDAVWLKTVAPDAVILNPPGTEAEALGFVGGLAALESAIAGCWPGQATIHADRGVAIYAAQQRQLERRGGSLFTPLDSRWAFYGDGPNTGPDGLPAPDGHAWLYATGQVTLARFPVLYPDPVMPLRRDPATGQMTNEPYVLAERTYISDVPCCKFAVLVCLSVCP